MGGKLVVIAQASHTIVATPVELGIGCIESAKEGNCKQAVEFVAAAGIKGTRVGLRGWP